MIAESSFSQNIPNIYRIDATELIADMQHDAADEEWTHGSSLPDPLESPLVVFFIGAFVFYVVDMIHGLATKLFNFFVKFGLLSSTQTAQFCFNKIMKLCSTVMQLLERWKHIGHSIDRI